MSDVSSHTSNSHDRYDMCVTGSHIVSTHFQQQSRCTIGKYTEPSAEVGCTSSSTYLPTYLNKC